MLPIGTIVVAPMRLTIRPTSESRTLGKIADRHRGTIARVMPEDGIFIYENGVKPDPPRDESGGYWVEFSTETGKVRQYAHESEVEEVK